MRLTTIVLVCLFSATPVFAGSAASEVRRRFDEYANAFRMAGKLQVKKRVADLGDATVDETRVRVGCAGGSVASREFPNVALPTLRCGGGTGTFRGEVTYQQTAVGMIRGRWETVDTRTPYYWLVTSIHRRFDRLGRDIGCSISFYEQNPFFDSWDVGVKITNASTGAYLTTALFNHPSVPVGFNTPESCDSLFR